MSTTNTTNPVRQSSPVSMHTGAVIDGIQTEAEVLMARHTPKDWPSAPQALDSWQALCEGLQAEDKELPIRALKMNPQTGGLFNSQKVANNYGIIPTRTALSHLMGFITDKPREAVDNLEFYPPAVRASMLAYALSKVQDRGIVMRCAVNNVNQYVVRAVTSEKHSKAHGDDLAIIEQLRRLPSHIMQNAKMRVVKQWDNTHVELVIPNKVREVRPGIIIQARINLSNSETKGGSFEASVGTMNLVCINGMIGGGNKSTVSVKHMGDIRTRMRAGVVTVIDLADVYLEDFELAYQRALPKTRAEAIEATVKRFKLPETTSIALASVWDVDGERSAGNTVAGLANAMTRYAQQLPVEQALKLEAAAGEVVESGLDFL